MTTLNNRARSFITLNVNTGPNHSHSAYPPRAVSEEEFESIENEFLDELFFQLDCRDPRADIDKESDLARVWSIIIQCHPDRLARIVRKCLHFIANVPDRFSHAHDLLLSLVIPDCRLPFNIVCMMRSELARIREETPYRTILRAVIELEWELDKYHA